MAKDPEADDDLGDVDAAGVVEGLLRPSLSPRVSESAIGGNFPQVYSTVQ